MIPRSPIKRRSAPARTAIKKSNPQRKKREFARAYGSKKRVEFVKSLPCVACGVVGYSENAHIETGGVGRRADADQIVPLCSIHHGLLHQEGRGWFEAAYDVDLEVAAISTVQRWLERGDA